MNRFLRAWMIFTIAGLSLLSLSACGSSDEPEVETQKPTRLMTAPALQQDIQKAQEAGSLSELYAEGAPPEVTVKADPVMDANAPQDVAGAERTMDDVAREITTPAQEPAAGTQADEPSQSNPLNTPEEQARLNSETAANQRAPLDPIEQRIAAQEQAIANANAPAQQTANNAPMTTAPAMPSRPVISGGAVLNAGETLKVTVFNDPDLSGEYEIDKRGAITMPLLGDIQAAGLTAGELQYALESQLAMGGILVDPSVSIEVVALRPFYILGEVREPGSYPTVPDMDVFKALAIAGGLTPRAVDDEFIIYRGAGENRQTIEATEETLVLPGDSIKVKERFF